MENSRIIKTGMFSKIAYEVFSSVIGQLSDGWGENNPSNDKWWRFADVKTEPNGEVVIEIDNRSYIAEYGYGYGHCHSTSNGFYHMSDDEIKAKFAKWIKKTMKMELDDENDSNGWKRDNVSFKTGYLNSHEDISVAQVYCIYEHLLGRLCGISKYDPDLLHSVYGSPRSNEETKKAEDKKNALEQLDKQLSENIKTLEDEKKAKLAEITKLYDDKMRTVRQKYWSKHKAIEAA